MTTRAMPSPDLPPKIPISAIPSSVWIFLIGAMASGFIAWGWNTSTLGAVTTTLAELRAVVVTKSDMGTVIVRIDRLERRDDASAQTDVTVLSRLAGIEAELKALRYDLTRSDGRRTDAGPLPSGPVGGGVRGRPADR